MTRNIVIDQCEVFTVREMFQMAIMVETKVDKRIKALSATSIVGATAILWSASAMAQSTVTLYGIMDAGVEVLTGAPDSKGHSSTLVREESGGVNSSRIGLRGSEDLGGGLKAIFTLEGGNIDYNWIWHSQNDRIEYSVPKYLVQSATDAAAVAYSLQVHVRISLPAGCRSASFVANWAPAERSRSGIVVAGIGVSLRL